MAMPAFKIEPEKPVESRIAVLETKAGRIEADIAEIKTDIRSLKDSVASFGGELKTLRWEMRLWLLLVAAAGGLESLGQALNWI